jgi:phage tail tape-measure protein
MTYWRALALGVLIAVLLAAALLSCVSSDNVQAQADKSGGSTTKDTTIDSSPKPKTTPPRPSPSPPPRPTLATPPLFKAGGPEDGPVPIMPSDGCPEEFPVKKGKACYPA